MPSVAVTPLSYAITWGTPATVPARIASSPLALVFTGGSVAAGPGTGTSLAVTTPTLDRLVYGENLTNPNGGVGERFQLIWQQTMEAIEDAFAALTTQVTDNTTLLNRIIAAQNLAQAANDNATAVSEAQDLADSYTDPTSVLTASNDGSIAIAAHSRVYPVSGTTVAVNSGSVSGFASGNYVTVYYKDAGRAGGAVTYQGTTNAVAQTGSVHIVGQVTIPAAGAASVSGSGPTAPGYTSPSTGGADYETP